MNNQKLNNNNNNNNNNNINLSFIKKFTEFREFMILIIIMFAGVVMAFASPFFLNSYNIKALLLGVAVQGIIAIGMTILMSAGDFDLSVGSTLALTGAVVAMCLKAGIPLPISIIFALLAGGLVGLINGLIVAKIGINPFITTLGMMKVVRGLVLIITGGNNITGLPKSFNSIGQASFYGIQNPIWISIIMILIADILLRKTKFFRQNYYIGGNSTSALFSGINVDKMRVLNFIIIGVLSAVGGILMTARFGSATVTAGTGLELQVVAGVIIGGASLSGGEGTVIGAFLGAFLMGLIVNSMNLIGVDVYWQTFVQGGILLLAVIIDQYSKKRSELQSC